MFHFLPVISVGYFFPCKVLVTSYRLPRLTQCLTETTGHCTSAVLDNHSHVKVFIMIQISCQTSDLPGREYTICI